MENCLMWDHAFVKVVLQVVELQQAVVSIVLLDFFQRLLQQQTAQRVHKDLHRRLRRVSSAYHAFRDQLMIRLVRISARLAWKVDIVALMMELTNVSSVASVSRPS